MVGQHSGYRAYAAWRLRARNMALPMTPHGAHDGFHRRMRRRGFARPIDRIGQNPMQLMPRCLAIALLCLTASCSEADGPDKGWIGFATHRETGRLEWFFPRYRSREDCIAGTEEIALRTVNSSWYRAPTGCGYAGYQNKFVLYLVNLLLGAQQIHCIARHHSGPIAEAGIVYDIVLQGYGDRGQGWRCVLTL